MTTIKQINQRVIEFGHNYEHEKQRVMKTLLSCKNIPQLENAKNYFKLLLKKWDDVLENNATIRTLVEIDEHKFYKEYNSMCAQFNYL
jgi:hypothetical protein